MLNRRSLGKIFVVVLGLVVTSSLYASNSVFIKTGCFVQDGGLNQEISNARYYSDTHNLASFTSTLYFERGEPVGIEPRYFSCKGRKCVSELTNSGGIPYIYVANSEIILSGWTVSETFSQLSYLKKHCANE